MYYTNIVKKMVIFAPSVMKICAVFNIYPHYRQAVYQLMDSELGVDFLFGDSTHDGIALSDARKLTGFRGYLKNKYKGSKLVWQRGAIRKAFSAKYDKYILTGNTGILSNWVILLIARALGREVFLWTHSLYGNEKGMTKRKNLLYLKLASGLLCYNERGARLAVENGVKQTKVHTIYNSLDYKKELEALKKSGDQTFARNYFGNKLPYVTFLGRLTKVKQIDMLLHATQLSKQNYNIIIVGEGSERETLEKLSEQLQLLDRVWFYGECYDQTMLATIIKHSAAVVSPGNAGLNAIHTLTFQTPLITHNNLDEQMPEVEAVVQLQNETKCKLLYQKDSIQSLAQVIDEVITKPKEIFKMPANQIVMTKWNANNQINILKNIFGM